MNKTEEFIEIKDLDSIQRALTNAEIEHEVVTDGDIINDETVIVIDTGLKFYFDDYGQLTGISP